MASLGARRRRRAPAAESSSGRVEVEVIMVEVEDSPLFFSFYKSNTTKLRNKIFLGLPQKAPRSSLSLLSLVLVLLVGYFGRRLNFLFGCFFFYRAEKVAPASTQERGRRMALRSKVEARSFVPSLLPSSGTKATSSSSHGHHEESIRPFVHSLTRSLVHSKQSLLERSALRTCRRGPCKGTGR